MTDAGGGKRPRTLGELRDAGIEVRPVREEIRHNLMLRLAEGADLFPGIVGYDDSVIPQLQNAILAGQDIIFLGERGQAKSRIIRSLTALLDEFTPVIDGAEIPENPYAPVTASGRRIVAEHGDATPIRWMGRDERYGEKLATPDITIADLIGEVDPIKVAEGRHLSDEETLHLGLIPRTNRGIFAINEMPDLAERIQVGLLNLLEERDIQVRGFKVRLPLDVLVVASANPEDYTNRGRIITPLKDRYGAQIRTHYPATLEDEIRIVDLEAAQLPLGDYRLSVPDFIKEIVVELTRLCRESPDVSQRSGVSVRASIANFESILANALRRAIRVGEYEVVPRISDLPFLLGSLQGKVEFETIEEGREDQVMEKMLARAVSNVFDRRLDLATLEAVIDAFNQDARVEAGEGLPSTHYEAIISQVPALTAAIAPLINADTPALRASAVEFVLEGLHLHKLLNKDRLGDRLGGQSRYTSG